MKIKNKSYISYDGKQFFGTKELIKYMTKEIERLREALEFYADEKMWSTTIKTAKELAIIAQQALKEEGDG